MGSGDNILIVEDEDEWRGIYQRAMATQGSGYTIKVTPNLVGAEQLIDAAKFAVAFVDVGLDAADDGNVDGLRVMEKIRATGDETSIVVVTGRSGQDVLSITRDAIKKYGAYDTIGKSTIKPSDIKRLLAGALEAYRTTTPAERTAGRDALKGDADPFRWDENVMRVTQFKGDAVRFYEFLNELLTDYSPLLTRHSGERAYIDPTTGLVHGGYWSRGIGASIVVCLGPKDTFDQSVAAARADDRLLGRYNAGPPLKTIAGSGVKGVVFPLQDCRREDFNSW